MRAHLLRAALPAALALACGPGNPVPVVAPADQLARLTGNWEGSYRGDDNGRSGTIDFRLLPGRDTAYGEVVMVPAGWDSPVEPVNGRQWDASGLPNPTSLGISFVRLDDGRVSGVLDPYRDPECGCHLTTTFEGTLVGDTLRGRYVSLHQESRITTGGVWQAVRTPPKTP
jgi:hypothetical protein